MTSLVGEYTHPKDCPVCSNGVVSVRLVGPHGIGGVTQPRLSQVSRIAHVIACPQCTGALGLQQVLSPHGGAA